MDKDSKFTRDSEGYIAVRTVGGTEALPATDKDYLFGRDENGNIAMRVVGLGGGSGGAVNSVNGKTGTVVLTAEDVGALPDSTVIPAAQVQSDWEQADSSAVDYIKNKPTIPAAQVNADWAASSGVAEILNKPTIPDAIQYSTMPTASATNEGDIVQFTGTTDATYTNGYFYKCASTSSDATITQSSSLDITFNKNTFETQITTTGQYTFQYDVGIDAWLDWDNNQVNLADYGISYSGVPVNADTITVTYTAASYSWNQTNVQPMGATINDNATTSLTETWSANKLNSTVGDIETLLAAI